MENINLYFSIAICVFGALILILTAYIDSIVNSLESGDALKDEKSFQNCIKGLISVGIILLVGGGSYLYTHFIAKCSCSSNQFDFKIYLGLLGVLGLVLVVLSYRINSEVVAKNSSSVDDVEGQKRRTDVSASLANLRWIMLFASGVILIASVGFLVKKIVDEKNEKEGESGEKVSKSIEMV